MARLPYSIAPGWSAVRALVVIAVSGCVVSPAAFGAIALDAVSSASDASGNAVTLTYSHTCSGSDRVLSVAVATRGSSVSSVTYGAVPLVLAEEAAPAMGAVRVALFYVANPASGANDVVVTLGSSDVVLSRAVSVSGADTANPVNASDGTSAFPGGMSAQLSFTTTRSTFLVDAIAVATSDVGLTPSGAGQVQRWVESSTNLLAPLAVGGSTEAKGTAGNETMQWSWTLSQAYAYAAIAFNEPLPDTPTNTPGITPTPTPVTPPTPTATLAPICDPFPSDSCRGPGTAIFLLKNKQDDGRDKLVWKWARGDATDLAQLGDPTLDVSYALCVYDESGDVPHLVMEADAPAAGNCAGRPCWKRTGSKGFKYRDAALTPHGLLKIIVKAGSLGNAKAIVVGKGQNLPMPSPVAPNRLLEQDTDVIVQLVNTIGECWTSTYAAPARRNTTDQFKAKSTP